MRGLLGVAMCTYCHTILFDSLRSVVANTMEKVVRGLTQVMPMVHVCCYHLLSLSRLVPCVSRPKFIPADCRHNGPKDNQIQLFMGQERSLSSQVCVMFLREQCAARLTTGSCATTGSSNKFPTLGQFCRLL